MIRGYFTFVLHSHLPYVRHNGRWPHGEQMIYEALVETYLPLLSALDSVRSEGLQPRLTLGLTPILLEQIADPDVANGFRLFLEERIDAARADRDRFRARGAAGLETLASFYLDWYADVQRVFQEDYRGNVVGAFRRLQEDGTLEVITSAATHAYLPLVARDSSITAQLSVGTRTTDRHFRRRPQGAWLPECGYRPGVAGRRGLDDFLGELGIRYFFADSWMVAGANPAREPFLTPSGPAAEDAVLATAASNRSEARPAREVLRPYLVEGSGVAVYGREPRTSLRVWSAAHGYPAHGAYREFHRRDEVSGLAYWRVTGAEVAMGDKDLYDPGQAREQVARDADDFCWLVHELVDQYAREHQQPGLIVSAYDTELFGHWWFEGIEWLKAVLRRLARSESVGLTTAGAYLDHYPPTEAISLPEGSWATGGSHATWLNERTSWLWERSHAAEAQMERLVAQYPDARGWRRAALNQAARELLLLQASDWPFLITTGQAPEYATERFQQHEARFEQLVALAEGIGFGEAEQQLFETLSRLDNPFPDLDYRVFAAR